MPDLEPTGQDGADNSGSAFGYRHETPEQRYARRSRNVTVVVAVIAALVLLTLLAIGFAALSALHAITSALTGTNS